jgi:hypothetical protein
VSIGLFPVFADVMAVTAVTAPGTVPCPPSMIFVSISDWFGVVITMSLLFSISLALILMGYGICWYGK